MEAESIVIFAPISQLGCFKACVFVTDFSCSKVQTLKCVVPQQVAEVESVTLTVSGWNVPEKKIKLFLDGMK